MPTTTIATTFGALLKQLRRRVGMTQGELAALVGVSLSQISLLEKDKRQPDLQQLVERFIPEVLGSTRWKKRGLLSRRRGSNSSPQDIRVMKGCNE